MRVGLGPLEVDRNQGTSPRRARVTPAIQLSFRVLGMDSPSRCLAWGIRSREQGYIIHAAGAISH